MNKETVRWKSWRERTACFNIVVSFDAPDRKAVYREICEKVQQAYPDYTLQLAMDMDFSEETAEE